MEFYKGSIPIIDTDASTGMAMLFPKKDGGGNLVTYGCVERDYSLYPEEMFSKPDDMFTIPESEWDARYDEQEELKSSLEHLYLAGPNGGPLFVNLDQNGDGYCWIYSNGHALMFCRIVMNQPLVRLNPHSSGAIIKRGRDEGGWCGLGAKFVGENGMAPEGNGPGQWPLHSRNISLDTPEMRESMAKFKLGERFMDMTKQDYDHKLTARHLATCGFMGYPSPSDFNWWGHSVCQIRWVRIERGSWGPLILNSWKGWGRHGLAVLRGSQATANGAIAYRTATATAA